MEHPTPPGHRLGWEVLYVKSFFLTFRSITYAQRAELAFSREGIPCYMRRAPKWMEERGCGYGLEVKLSALKQGLDILRREKITFRKSYLLHPDGTVEEMSL